LVNSEFNSPQKQAASGKINQMQTAGANTAGAEASGKDVLALLATTVDQGLQRGTPAVGSNFANNVIFCFTAATKTGLSLPIAFGPSLDPTVDGAFAVRGGTSDSPDPVVTRLGGSALAVKPASNSSFAAAFGVRTLIYANPNTSTPPGIVGKAYDWNTVPKVSALAARTLVLGICAETSKSLLQEDAAVVLFESVAFLERQSITNPGGQPSGKRALCDTDLASAVDDGLGLFAWARRLFVPAPAFAAAVNPGGTGGKPRAFSTFYALDGVNFVLQFTQQPTNNFTNTPITVKLKATASVNSAPIEGIGVSLTVVGNSGSFTLSPAVPKGVTDTAGEVAITFQLDKAGGYTMRATTDSVVNAGGTTHSFDPASVNSNLFNLQQAH